MTLNTAPKALEVVAPPWTPLGSFRRRPEPLVGWGGAPLPIPPPLRRLVSIYPFKTFFTDNGPVIGDVTCVAFWTVIEVAYRSRILTLTFFVLLRYLCGFSFCFFLSFSFSMLLFYDKLRVIKLNIQLFMFVFV